MDIETAQQVIAALCLSHTGFKPFGEPTLTPTGARIEFMQPKVSMATVAEWFTGAGVRTTMVGVTNVYATVPTWIAEFRR